MRRVLRAKLKSSYFYGYYAYSDQTAEKNGSLITVIYLLKKNTQL